jgi:hypothetical protein
VAKRKGGYMRASIGVDTHKGSLAAAAVDELGRVLGVKGGLGGCAEP